MEQASAKNLDNAPGVENNTTLKTDLAGDIKITEIVMGKDTAWIAVHEDHFVLAQINGKTVVITASDFEDKLLIDASQPENIMAHIKKMLSVSYMDKLTAKFYPARMERVL